MRILTRQNYLIASYTDSLILGVAPNVALEQSPGAHLVPKAKIHIRKSVAPAEIFPLDSTESYRSPHRRALTMIPTALPAGWWWQQAHLVPLL